MGRDSDDLIEETRCSKTTPLFDHVVGRNKQGSWHLEPERLGRFEIQRGLELGRRLHWKVARLVAAQDAVNIKGRLATCVDKVDSVGHTTAGEYAKLRRMWG